MIEAKLFVCNIIFWLITSQSILLIRAEEKQNNSSVRLNDAKGFNVLPGIKLFLIDGEIIVHMKIRDLLKETEVQSRRNKGKKNPLQQLGVMMMMTPFVMQVLSLPGAIASIKMTLLRNIMVAQLAIAIMFYNLLKSIQNKEVVVVHQPHQHHAHYYHGYYKPEDEDDGWFGR